MVDLVQMKAIVWDGEVSLDLEAPACCLDCVAACVQSSSVRRSSVRRG